MNQLVDQQASPDVPRERQLTLDAHIQQRIQSELSRLHAEEARVREEIELALEKENLDRERGMAGEEAETGEVAASAGSVKSSAALMGDLEELRQKVEKYRARQDSEELADVRAKGEEVVSCYQYVFKSFSLLFHVSISSKVASDNNARLLESRRGIQELRDTGRTGTLGSAQTFHCIGSQALVALCQLAEVVVVILFRALFHYHHYCSFLDWYNKNIPAIYSTWITTTLVRIR